MWTAALAAPTVVFLFALSVLRGKPGRSVALAAPLALAVTLCFEAALLNVLSLFHAVARGPLLVAHGGVAAVAARRTIRRLRERGAPRLERRATSPQRFVLPALLLVLAVPIAYSALFYVPNNWDSMTYHLGRVAHWLQRRSVGSFETNIARQVTYPPGAEYLLTVLQAISGTDRLSSFVQFSSWLIVALAAAPLGRTFGVPRSVAPWASLLFAAAPMAVLQASSTQNDLVASAVAVAIVTGCLPFLHRRPRWRPSDVLVGAMAVSAGVLAKPTALVITAPFMLWAAVAGARGLGSEEGARGRRLLGIMAAACIALCLLVPEAARRARGADPGDFTPFLYPPLSEGADRAANVARGLLRHVVLPSAWTSSLARAKTLGCGIPHSLCAGMALQANEDLAGNPASAVIALCLLLLGAARWKSLSGRKRAVLGVLPSAWVIFCFVFRDNAWIARLHLPFFALLPLAAVALSGAPGRRASVRRALPIAGGALVLLGAHVAFRNELRPVPNPVHSSTGLLPGAYYAGRPDQWSKHAVAIAGLSESGCRRLGLFIGGDSYDYPLTWQVMQRGVQVRHTMGPDPWPCAVYSDRGVPPAPPGVGWYTLPSAPELYLRAPGSGKVTMRRD